MVTSDSEDFESADEELESTHSIKQKVSLVKDGTFTTEKSPDTTSTSKPVVFDRSEADISSNKTVVKNEHLSDYKASEKVVVIDNSSHVTEISTIKENVKSEAVKSSNRRSTNLKSQALKAEAKQKLGIKKLGMKLSNVKDSVVRSDHSERNVDNVPITSNVNVTMDAEKQIVKSSDLVSKSIKDSSSEVESIKNTSLVYTQSQKNSIIESITSDIANLELKKVFDSKSVNSGGKSNVESQSSVKESSSDLSIMNKSASGDGWEVEEEDGFQVPVSLSTKPKSEIIQNQREISPVFEKLSAAASQPEVKGQSWGSWGGWGVTSLLSTATESVSSFSSHVTSGFSTVLESSLGVPDPEALAKHVVQEEKQFESNSTTKLDETASTITTDDTATAEGHGFSGLGSLMSGVGLLGTKVLSGGLDTLETLGKKTMEVLQEGDPLLRKKRAIFFQDPDKPVLSQILKEAKEKAENSDKEQAEKEATRKAHFETLFDDYQGLVHLEALEMLSKQCQLKLQSILLSYSGNELLDLQETLSEVKELCELPEDEDDEEVMSSEEFEKKITECMKNLYVNLSSSKIIQVYESIEERLKELANEEIAAVELHQNAISSMAEFTAYAMECFHKGAELVLTKTHRSTADEAENFVQLTTIFCSQVSSIANEFTSLLTKWDPVANNTYITNIFLEAGNSVSYIQNACQLLLPVIQVGAAS